MYALIDSNNFFVSCERLFRPDLDTVPTIVLSSNDGCAISRSNEAKALGIKMGEPIFKLRERFQIITPASVAAQTRAQRGRPLERAAGWVRAASEQSDTGTRGEASLPSRMENSIHLAHIHRKPLLAVFSANFELYGDISERISTLVTSITPHIEVYSIDESFLDLDHLDITDYEAWGRAIRASILQNIGIPVSIGIASTKTLCKLANHWAKTHDTDGVYALLGSSVMSQESAEGREQRAESNKAIKLASDCKKAAEGDATSSLGSWLLTLGSTHIEDVWGVGWKLAPKLKAEGIFTALDLARMRPQRAQQLMGIHGRHMVYELNGTRCLPLQQKTKPQRMVSRGRQFGEDTSDFAVIEAAVTTLATRAARELRREGQLALRAGVALRTNRHKPGYTSTFDNIRFYTPTADEGTICSQLIRTLQRTFRKGLPYHKAEIVLYDLIPQHSLQADVFGCVSLGAHDRSQRRMKAIDTINATYGQNSIRLAAETLSNTWRPRSAMLSPRYTSNWYDLPLVDLADLPEICRRPPY